MKLAWIGILLVVGMLIFGCTSSSSTPVNTNAPPGTGAPPKFTATPEKVNLQNRLNIMNSPSTTMWIYGLGQNGNIIFKSAVNGKVTSSTKRLQPTTGTGYDGDCATQFTDSNGVEQCSDEIMQPDGTFGTSDQYVFWFDYAGNYFQWSGLYIESSQPLHLNEPVLDFQQVNDTSSG